MSVKTAEELLKAWILLKISCLDTCPKVEHDRVHSHWFPPLARFSIGQNSLLMRGISQLSKGKFAKAHYTQRAVNRCLERARFLNLSKCQTKENNLEIKKY